jgi:hypothetical protein
LALWWAAQTLSFGYVKCAGLNASGIPFSLIFFCFFFSKINLLPFSGRVEITRQNSSRRAAVGRD